MIKTLCTLWILLASLAVYSAEKEEDDPDRTVKRYTGEIPTEEEKKKEEEKEGEEKEEDPFLNWIKTNIRSDTTRDKIGGIELGLNFFMQRQVRYIHYYVNNVGFKFGFLFPINVPYLVSYLKITTFFHGAETVWNDSIGKLYLTASNELIIGKNFYIKNQPFEYIPFFGYGFSNGIAMQHFSDIGVKGYQTHYFQFWDIGILVRRRIVYKKYRFSVGVAINFERAFIADEDTKTRFNINAVGIY
jgi:hypothetical protein